MTMNTHVLPRSDEVVDTLLGELPVYRRGLVQVSEHHDRPSRLLTATGLQEVLHVAAEEVQGVE